MPRKSLQGRTCSVSRDGRRARALQPRSRSKAPRLGHTNRPIHFKTATCISLHRVASNVACAVPSPDSLLAVLLKAMHTGDHDVPLLAERRDQVHCAQQAGCLSSLSRAAPIRPPSPKQKTATRATTRRCRDCSIK
ncbi:hypothetical protein XAC3417 [Xanthomonas citri pv. citri str. 306]|uniref:Uncharacterized protein n=1 Tax=Xanthomonas axonopodis pv. citri (strain 306) TaxID=190486 RepID=A0AAI8ETV4_XANAC|nr:hypothetical protein XAC3417 [Xanthomonas citri pv. citri str. 306]QYF46343.1 hypothetical protein HZS93_04732 [Xanthomonas citri]